MGEQFNPQVGDRVIVEVDRIGQRSAIFSGMIRQVDPSREWSYQVQLDDHVPWMLNRSLLWFRPQDLSEEYLD